jgi:tetratricopeptide (TPR) repeat protein
MAEVLNNLAVLATMRVRLDEAWTLYEQVLALDEQAGPSPQTVLTCYNMGMLRADQERWDEALELYGRSLELCRTTRHLTHEPNIELNRAEALMGKGSLVEAREACSRALRGFRRLDDALGMADALRLYGRLCRLERNWDDSLTYLEKSVELNRQFGESISLGEALYELGLLNRDAGRSASALEPLREAKAIFVQAQAELDLKRVRTVIEEVESA